MNLLEMAFAHRDALERLAAVRLTLGLVVAALALSPAFGAFHAESEPLLYDPDSRVPRLARHLSALRAAVALLGVLAALGVGGPVVLLAMAGGFALLDAYVARFTPQVWSNFFHVHVFALCCSVASGAQLLLERGSAAEVASFALTTMSLQVGLVYFLAGLSKLRLGGFEWFSSGRTVLAASVFRGTALGRRVLAVDTLRSLVGVGTGLFELGAPLLLFWPSLHRSFAIIAFAFHMGTLGTLRISFWHLWVFFPALFLLQ
ncbi:MAG: hypothetical protein RL685_874 [Pseudomonadota bacterium]|jgi:hypothetical protein